MAGYEQVDALLAALAGNLDNIVTGLKTIETDALETALLEFGSAESGWPLHEFVFRSLIEEEVVKRWRDLMPAKLESIKLWLRELASVPVGGPEYVRKLDAIAAAIRGLYPDWNPSTVPGHANSGDMPF